MSTKVLLDTDIGNDIDDALCLAYLLAQPECELLGVTTVTGEAEKRAMMVSALCKIAGKNIPVMYLWLSAVFVKLEVSSSMPG